MASLKLVFVAFSACWLASSIYGVQLIRAGNLSCNEKQQILNQHNKLRQSVALGQVRGQPPAANMRELVWDEELASIAQNWANRGVIQHNTPRSGRFPVGENIAATWTFQNPSPSGSTPDFNKVINDWFVESSAFPGSGVSSYHFDRTTGHYTQIAWATTTYLGCGYSYYYDTQKGYTKFYVCNYGPAGNIIGGTIYERGQPSCSSFKLIPSRGFPGLCEVPNTNPSRGVCGISSQSIITTPALFQTQNRIHNPPQTHFVHHPFYWGR